MKRSASEKRKQAFDNGQLERFEIFTTANGQTHFRFKAGNHEIVLAGEGYHNRQDALSAITLIQRRAAGAAIVDADTGEIVSV